MATVIGFNSPHVVQVVSSISFELLPKETLTRRTVDFVLLIVQSNRDVIFF